MTANEYQEACLRTCSSMSPRNKIIMGTMGMAGESGEALDIVKKHLFHGHPLDTEHLKRELGDVLWYVAVSAHAMGIPLEDVMVANIEKLKARYPEGFDTEHSLHRQEGDI